MWARPDRLAPLPVGAVLEVLAPPEHLLVGPLVGPDVCP